MKYSAAGGSITESDSPTPGHLAIKQAKVARDTDGLTVSYTVKEQVPHAGSDIEDADYSTWLGNGGSNAGVITMLYLNSTWSVTVLASNAETGGEVDVQPTVTADTVTLHLPLKVRTTGGIIDLSDFTHVGWSSSGKDPSRFGSWLDGCPVDGLAAGDPGNWLVRMR